MAATIRPVEATLSVTTPDSQAWACLATHATGGVHADALGNLALGEPSAFPRRRQCLAELN